MAIRWVNENIHAFQGDPGKVTLFGESAGGWSVIYQMLSPLNKGLIHGAICQSGAVLKTTDPNPSESAKMMAKRLNCSDTSSSELLIDCLRNLSWEEIILKQTEFFVEQSVKMVIPVETVSPVVEPKHAGAFITAEPIEIIKSGDIPNIPVMLGANKHDGSGYLANLYLARIGPLKLDQDPEYMREQLIPDILKWMGIRGDEANRAVASTMEMTYFPGVNRSSWNESMPGLVDILTVLPFKSVIEAAAKLLSKRGLPVYLYSLEHHSSNSVWPLFFGSVDLPIEHGVTHGDVNFSQADQEFSNKMGDMWLNFGIHGDPTSVPCEGYEKWPTYNPVNESYMKLNGTPTVMSGYRNSWRPNGFQWN